MNDYNFIKDSIGDLIEKDKASTKIQCQIPCYWAFNWIVWQRGSYDRGLAGYTLDIIVHFPFDEDVSTFTNSKM